MLPQNSTAEQPPTVLPNARRSTASGRTKPFGRFARPLPYRENTTTPYGARAVLPDQA